MRVIFFPDNYKEEKVEEIYMKKPLMKMLGVVILENFILLRSIIWKISPCLASNALVRQSN